MKLKQKFVLREIADDFILIPIQEADDNFCGIITLNETSAFIWKQIEERRDKEQILELLMQEYNVDKETAIEDIEVFLNKLIKLGILE